MGALSQNAALWEIAGAAFGIFAGGIGIGWAIAWAIYRFVVAPREKDQIGAKVNELEEMRDSLLGAISEDAKIIWRRPKTSVPTDYHERMANSIPIISVANLKGGVGKTTLVANLAAYLENRHNQKVLMIDLDFQGSLSSTFEQAAGITEPQPQANHLIAADKPVAWLYGAALPLEPVLSSGRIITSFYDFANVENQMMVKWLMANDGHDIRYNLAGYLLDPEVQEKFDTILIDCPPRMTTGFVNALCSSTHLLVPTVLDRLSSEAVTAFLAELRNMKPDLFPSLNLLGVVATKVRNDTERTDYENRSWDRIEQSGRGAWGDDVYLFREATVPIRTAIARSAGYDVVYREDRDAQEIFDRLGDAVKGRL